MTGLCCGPFRKPLYAVLLISILLISASCTSAPLRNARSEFYGGSPHKASEILDNVRKISKRDRLLFLMEKGLILHHQGHYEKSTAAFLEASELIRQQEVINAGRQAGSMVTTEWLTEYKGEYSERLWVHTYLMMNFLLLQNNEAALVEAKQALEVFEKHPEALSDDYFTRGLIALCFENIGLNDDAYIEYRKLAEHMDGPGPVAGKLYQLGTELGIHEEADRYKTYIPEEDLDRAGKASYAELVLFISQGRAPVKIPGNIVIPPSIRFSFPRYKDSDGNVSDTAITGIPAGPPGFSISTDLEKVARASFKKRAAMVIAKETARAAGKEVMSRKAGKEYGDTAEIILRAIFFILEEPDTRSWHTLPAGLALIRLPLEQAGQSMAISIGGSSRTISLTDKEINSGRRVYRSIRVYN